MANRFSTGNDYSSTFQNLWESNFAAMQASAQRIDAQREADLAARDSLVFAKWQEGKLSGNELMAYINSRMRQTGYDKSQQAKWREAAITYGTQIADDQAEAQYAQTGNISALIGHYASRLAQAKKGTPEYLELAQRVKTLTEQRDADSLRKQAKKISRAIERGDAKTSDLIAFYRQQLGSLPRNSPLREQVQDTLSELRSAQHQEQFSIAMQKIDTALAAGAISPMVASAQKSAVLVEFDIAARDPLGFIQWQEQVRQLRATPDPTEIAKLEFDLAAGNITEAQYADAIDAFANRIAPFDQAAAWQLRIEAEKIVGASRLPNPGALGLPGGPSGSTGYSGTIEVVRNLAGNSIRHITQMDGSGYSDSNCTMAAGAMLAHAMGYRGLTGADLRWLSGVTSNATNIQQLQGALEQVGVEGTKLRFAHSIAFEAFKQRVANGAPAVLSGWLGFIPASLNTAGIAAGHGMFVAGYDPKRKAFLMLDPAKSSDQGTWWPEDIVENFGWNSERFGDALFAPKGTITPGTLQRSKGKVVHVSVNAPPVRPGTPAGAGGQFDPGPDVTGKIQKAERQAQAAEDRRLRRRLADAGLEPGPELDSVQEVEAELARREQAYMQLDAQIEEWARLYSEDGEPVQRVAIGGSSETLSRDDIGQMQAELLRMLDGQELLFGAMEDTDGVARMRKTKAEVVTTGVGLNSIEAQVGIGRLEREANAILGDIPRMTDPNQVAKALNDLGGVMEQLGAVEDAGFLGPIREDIRTNDQTEVEAQQDEIKTGVNDEIQAQQGYYAQVLAVVSNPGMTREERVDAIFQISEAANVSLPSGWPDDKIDPTSGSPQGRLAAEAMQRYDEINLLKTEDEYGNPMGEAMIVNGEMIVVPTKFAPRTDPNTGEEIPRRAPDLSYLDPKVVATLQARGFPGGQGLPIVVMPGSNGETTHMRVLPDFIPYAGVDYLVWRKFSTEKERSDILAGLPDDLRSQYSEGIPLSDETLEHPHFATAGAIQQAIRDGVLVPQTFNVERILVPGPNGTQKAWYQDADTRMWHPDNLPFIGRTGVSYGASLTGHGYVGMEVSETTGKAWPQVVTDPNDMDKTTLGVSTPYAAGMPAQQVGEYVQQFADAGIPVDPMLRRDLEGNVYTITPESPEYAEQWTKATMTLDQAISMSNRARAEAMDKLATVVPPDESADMAFWDEAEKRARARDMGIDYDTGAWLPSAPGGRPAKNPSQQILDDLGIVSRIQGPPEPQGGLFNPLAESLRRARGVAAANKAEQDRKRAEAASTAKTGLQTLPMVTTPHMTPPAGGSSSNPGSTSRTVVPTPAVPVGPSPTRGLPPITSQPMRTVSPFVRPDVPSPVTQTKPSPTPLPGGATGPQRTGNT